MDEPNLEKLGDRIVEYLVEMDIDTDAPATGPFLLRFGDAVILVSLFRNEGVPWVRIASTLLKDFRPGLELVTRVLRLNTEVLLGSFLLFEDDTLVFAATLPGEDLSSAQFRTVLDYVARVADRFGEELWELSGGVKVSTVLAPPEESP